jgi:PAS domain S-box-containing protein
MPEIKIGGTDLRCLFEGAESSDSLILSQLQDAVLIGDATSRIVYANAAFEQLLGWSVTDAVGQSLTFRFPTERRLEIDDRTAQATFGAAVAFDVEDYRRDGSRVWMHWRAKRIVDQQGVVLGTLHVGTDISDRKRAEAERQQLQEQLYQAQRLDTLGTLAGGIAHDLNNILAVILGFTELAMARPPNEELLRHMQQQVLTATHRGRDLVNRILSFSRFHHPERRPTALPELVAEAAKFIRATLPSTVEVTTTVQGECPAALVDPNQLHQVLLNLATNASHAMRDYHGRFSLTLSTTHVPAQRQVATGALAAGPYVVIAASDTGCGMDPSVQRRIFDPFFTTKKEGEGTGLGLSVVRAIVEGHGGGIDVETAPGRGATFTIYLPVAPGVTLPAVTGDEPFTPRLRARGETVAVIDDEEAMVSVTERVLQGFGYSTLSFRSAEKFHATFLTAPAGIHLLVTDQTMPGMTGLELARRLREAGHHLPVLLMTGFSKQLRPEHVEQLGHAALLRKPFNRTALARTVRDLLDDLPAAR